jgi:DNA-binding IclR family transcriptional regulator
MLRSDFISVNRAAEASFVISGGAVAEPALKPVPSVAKSCAIIRLLDSHMLTGVSLATISERLDITKSHCLQILRTLEAEGWVAHDAERRRYRLASSMLLDVAALSADSDAETRRDAVVTRLAAQLGLPCVLTRVNDDGSFTSIAKAEPAAELLVMSPLGYRFPHDAPAQMRARLAAYPPLRGRALLGKIQVTAYTPATLTDPDAISAEIEATRVRGFAIGRMEYQPGIMSIAAAVPDARGVPRMVLQCSSTREDVEPREIAIGEAVRAAAESLMLLA